MDRTSHAEALSFGAEEYRDVLEVLAHAGFDAQFTQTGGMCAAIEIVLGPGRYILQTDRDETLPWAREDHVGWHVGLYDDGPGLPDDGPVKSALSLDGSAATVLDLVRRALGILVAE